MNKLFSDIEYIMKMNELGEYLQNKYGLTITQVQGIKHKMQLVIEEMAKEEIK